MHRFQAAGCLCLLFVVTFILPVQAQVPTKRFSVFDGEWISSDGAFGVPAQSTMKWSAALDGKFSHLNYRIEMQTGDAATTLFEGFAYYQLTEPNQLRAFWADNSGDLHPITAEWDGDALLSNWGVDGKKQGRTRYELISSDEMAVTDWIKTEEGWRQFNHGVFQRQPIENP